MTELDIPPPAASWLPDLFAYLVGWLDQWTPDINSGDWPGRRCREAEWILGEIKSAQTGGIPNKILRYLQGTMPIDAHRSDPRQRALVVAQCIDSAFEPLHPRHYWLTRQRGQPQERLEGGLREIRSHFVKAGRFNKQAEHGLVLPKTPLRPGWASDKNPLEERAQRQPGVGTNQLKDRFENLVCYKGPDRSAYVVSHHRLRERDMDRDRIENEMLRVAFVPLAEQFDDLSLVASEPGGGRFEARPDPRREGTLADAAGTTLRAVESAGAQVALFPEWVVSPAILRSMTETLREIALEAAGGPALQLVVAGSGLSDERHPDSGLPYGECVVLGIGGRELWRQRKLNHYSVPAEDLESWGVSAQDPEKYRERFHAGRTLRVVDSALGRMVVLICQDLYETHPGDPVLDQLQPDWVFCPVLDSEIKVGRWTYQRALPVAERHGVSVVVVNSLVLPRRPKDRRPRKLGYGLCVDREHPYRFQIVECRVPPRRSALRSASRKPLFQVVSWTPEAWDRVHIGRKRVPRPG